MAKRVTLDDIAAELNLSKYTISRAISGKSGVSEQTRARVLECCKVLGYVRNSPKDEAKYILLFIPKSDMEDEIFWMRVLQGVEGAAIKNGFNVHVKIIRLSEDSTLASEIDKASGIIYVGYKSIEVMKRFQDVDCPSLLMTYPPENLLDIDTIYFADKEAGFALCEKLIKWGHKKIGFLGHVERPSSKNRFIGIKNAAHEYDLELAYEWSSKEYEEMEYLKKELIELQKQNELPTAIMCSNDKLALSLIYMLSNMMLSVPEDISVTSFNSDFDEILPIPLTSVGLSQKDYGKMAFEYLFERINNPKLPARRIVVVPKLLIKETAGPIKK